MSTIAEIALPASEFALRETFDRVPGARFDVAGVVAHSAEHVMPQMRVRASEIDTLRSLLPEDSTVIDARLLTDSEDRGLFWMEWGEGVRTAISRLVEGDTTILTAHASNGKWRFRIHFADRDTLSSVYQSCHDADFPVEIRNVQERTTLFDDGNDLTAQQYETLQAAIDKGYYDIPREVTTEDLADDLGISHQAISERLRRGHRTLVETGLSRITSDR